MLQHFNITNKKNIVKASVARRSAYDTSGIPTLDGDTQTLEQKLSGLRLASCDSNAATNVSEKMSLPLLQEPLMSPDTSVKPSGRLPSFRDRHDGSSLAGITAAVSARVARSDVGCGGGGVPSFLSATG